MLVSDSCSNEQTQLQRSLKQEFASMTTGLTGAIKEACKTFSDRFDCDVDENELPSEVDDGEIDSVNGVDNRRQNDSGSQGNTNVQRIIERAKAQDKTEKAKEPSVLEGMRSELQSAETGPKVNEDLAEIVNRLIQKGLSDEKLQDKLNKYPSPQNCEALCKVKANQLIWDILQPNTRSQDLRFQKVQTAMTKGVWLR